MPEPCISSDSDIVSNDTYCVECGYNLRTLRQNGLCPECATPIAESLGEPHHRGRELFFKAFGAAILPALFTLAAMPMMAGLGETSSLGLRVLALIVMLPAMATAPAVILVRSCLAWRRCRKRLFGRWGFMAISTSSLTFVLVLGTLSFVLYESRDSTVYLPGWDKKAYLSIKPDMTKPEVESLIGKPRATVPVTQLTGYSEVKAFAKNETWIGTVADCYSHRAGYCGWRHWVVYDENGLVTDTKRYWVAD